MKLQSITFPNNIKIPKTKQANELSTHLKGETNIFVPDNPKTFRVFGTSLAKLGEDFINPRDLCHPTFLNFDESYNSGHVPRYIDM